MIITATRILPGIPNRAAALTLTMALAMSPAWGLDWVEDRIARLDNAIDPSGSWQNAQGSLSLMLTGDALSFSYSSVFGPAAHICDGAGVAGLVGQGAYHHVDDQGTFAILVSEDGVRMDPVAGIASLCGAEWPGERFDRSGFAPVEDFRVITPVAHFHVVMPAPPIIRQAYVVQGDVVQAVPTRHEQAGDYVLGRFIGPKATTVGLIKQSGLQSDQQARQIPDISLIRSEYQAIREALPGLVSEQAEILDLSTEGGEATAFRDPDGNIRLLALELFFDTGMTREEFYFSKGSLIFVLRARHQYNAPVYFSQEEANLLGEEAFDAEKTTLSEDRFYFHHEKMIRWLDNDRNPVALESALFREKGIAMRERAHDLLSRFTLGQ